MHTPRSRSLVVTSATLAALLLGTSVGAQSAKQVPDLAKARVEARQLQSKSNWKAAATSYRKIVTAAPEDGPSWQRLGYCLHAMGELDEALEVHKKAAQFPVVAGVASYNAACVYALQGNKDKAFAWLEKAVKAGLPRPAHITTDPDLDSLRKDERYAEIVRGIKSRAKKLKKSEPKKLKKGGPKKLKKSEPKKLKKVEPKKLKKGEPKKLKKGEPKKLKKVKKMGTAIARGPAMGSSAADHSSS